MYNVIIIGTDLLWKIFCTSEFNIEIFTHISYLKVLDVRAVIIIILNPFKQQ